MVLKREIVVHLVIMYCFVFIGSKIFDLLFGLGDLALWFGLMLVAITIILFSANELLRGHETIKSEE